MLINALRTITANILVKAAALSILALSTLTACNKSDDETVKEAVKTALAEERAKQAEIEALRQANEAQIQERVKAEVQKELQNQHTSHSPSYGSTETVVVREDNLGYIMTQTDGYVYLRNAPEAKARKLRKLPDGTVITVLECLGYEYRADVNSGNEGSWCEVRIRDGLTGYVFNSYIRSGTP